jgi:hypothetical protein
MYAAASAATISTAATTMKHCCKWAAQMQLENVAGAAEPW